MTCLNTMLSLQTGIKSNPSTFVRPKVQLDYVHKRSKLNAGRKGNTTKRPIPHQDKKGNTIEKSPSRIVNTDLIDKRGKFPTLDGRPQKKTIFEIKPNRVRLWGNNQPRSFFQNSTILFYFGAKD